MSVLRRAKLRTPDGIESIEYPLGVDAENVEVANGENLSQRLARIDEDLEKNEEDIAAVSELAGTNKQNIGANEIRIDALERRSASVNKKPYYFDTVADMKAYQELKAGDMAITLGYYEPNDGGGAEYKIENVMSTDTFCFELSNGLYAIPCSNLENVLIYGVKKDGHADNTDILNNIINYNKKLYFPKGTYLFNQLIINNKSGFEIYGDGNKSVLKCNNTSSNFFDFIKMSNGENYYCHDLKIDSNYIGNNFTFSFINVSNSIIRNCYLIGATSQRTLNLQNFDNQYGYNNLIEYNYVIKDSINCNSGALIECTGELSGNKDQFLYNTRIINNTCICKSSVYTGDSVLFDCIETDNCKHTLISNNYCENTMHHGISLDTRNINTLCTENICISTSTLQTGIRNGIEVTGVNDSELQCGIISNNLIKNFATNGISVNARNYSISNNKIENSNRGIILLELCTEGNMINNNVCSNITEYGIYVSGPVAQARILNNNASIYVDAGIGGLLYIISPVSSTNNFVNGLNRITYLNGIHKNDNINGLSNTGFLLNLLSDGRLIFKNPKTNTWQSISKTDI